ncbi:leucine-rich repeat domain-containing protein [Pseudoteredinibacter isoporae]|uniref:leucine-rich repeat domain-containing protein n=1 Tax=Pseudoteredinibacter isoporae TaxID=570281 RepID=UPI003342C6F7
MSVRSFFHIVLIYIFCAAQEVNAQVFTFGPADTVTGCIACNGLAITVPNQNGGTTVTRIDDDAFSGVGLTSVTIPNSITQIGANAFESNNLGSVVIPDSVTSIGSGAFINSDLTSITLSNNLTTIETGTFFSNNLSSVTIPNGVTTIGSLAFSSNTLTTVTIPASVTSIDSHAFRTNDLSSILFEGNRPTLGTTVFFDNPSLSTIQYTNASAVGWPGAAIQGIVPTLLTAQATTPSVIPTLPPVALYILASIMLMFVNTSFARKFL